MNTSDPVTAILARLSERGVAAEVLSHEAVFTMADVRCRLSFPATAQVKSLAVIDKSGSGAWSVLCGIHADQRLSMSAVARHLETARSRLRFMTDDEVVAVVGMTRGAIGLVAPMDGVRGLLDVSFRSEESLYFGVGRHDMTVRVRCSSLIASGLVELADLEIGLEEKH